MNKALIVLLFVVCLAVYSEQQRTRCPRTQVFKTCGTRCPRICNVPPPRICTRECVRGCFCRDGLILRSRGSRTCVNPRNCPR